MTLYPRYFKWDTCSMIVQFITMFDLIGFFPAIAITLKWKHQGYEIIILIIYFPTNKLCYYRIFWRTHTFKYLGEIRTSNSNGKHAMEKRARKIEMILNSTVVRYLRKQTYILADKTEALLRTSTLRRH